MALTHAYLETERPTCPIPHDRAHEFFNEPLQLEDPILRSWVNHFNDTGIRFRLIRAGLGYQIYLHRVKLKHNSTNIEQWCCSTRERRMT